MTAPTLSAMRGASFKDKLAVLEAETPASLIPEPGALKPRYDDLKKSLSLDALVAGCPNAFIDFYYLATSGDGVGDDNLTADEMEARLINPDDYEEFEEVPMDKMPFVKDALVAAESALRGDVGEGEDPAGAVQDAYKALAEYFLGTDDLAKAAYFYEKCVTASVGANARNTRWTRAASSARPTRRWETWRSPSHRSSGSFDSPTTSPPRHRWT